MKPSWLGLSLLSLLAVPALGAPSDASSDLESGDHASLVTRGNRGLDTEEPSVFNEVEVPPLTQITPENFEEVTKDGVW
jgi:protein disulfide-isomerase